MDMPTASSSIHAKRSHPSQFTSSTHFGREMNKLASAVDGSGSGSNAVSLDDILREITDAKKQVLLV